MFGEQLKKSAVTGNHTWTAHVRTDSLRIPATEEYWEGSGSRVQGPVLPLDLLLVPCSLSQRLFLGSSLLRLLVPPY